MEHGRMDNSITLHGQVCRTAQVSHCNHEQTFYVFPLAVCRLSGVRDTLNVLVSQQGLEGRLPQQGDEVTVAGEVRSFNNRSGQGSRLVITVLARQLRWEQGEDENNLTLTGTLCKPPIYRRTPLGRDISDLMLAVNRRYGRSDYLPCIAWGSLAQRCAALPVGAQLTLEGRLQSRTYTKRLEDREEERTAFEVSVMHMQTERGQPEAVKCDRE